MHIATHYNKRRFSVYRSNRSLESKWTLIKYDVSKFISVHVQVVKINKSGTNAADTLRRAYKFYKTKHPKDLRSSYKHY